MSLLTSLVPSFTRSAAPVAREGAPVVKPVYDLAETDEGYALTAQLPGVSKDGLELTAETGAITITGRRTWKQPEAWATLYRESTDAAYELVLTHDNAVDIDKIHAELRDGVLRVALPKAEAVKPRKIQVG
ncbi:MAG TPA: Hsp20/alpha crystallin family protein [Rariglobus sp.]|jgi:HSP20 family molecular chaperone IbpA|nr:Hsp20/alpha crystallin family protein [Rariglobus sp.]